MWGLLLVGKLELSEKEKRTVLISLILGRKLLGRIILVSPSHLANTNSETEKFLLQCQKMKDHFEKFNPIALYVICRNKQEKLKRTTSSANCDNCFYCLSIKEMGPRIRPEVIKKLSCFS